MKRGLKYFWIVSIIVLLFILYVNIYGKYKFSSLVLAPVTQNYKMNAIMYIQDVLPSLTYKKVYQDCTRLFPRMKPDNSSAKNRLHAFVEKNGLIEQTFYGPAFLSYLQQVLGVRVVPSKVLPIEFRYYDVGSSMDWHRDSIVTRNNSGSPQIELVYTLENISDSMTEWIDDASGQVNKIVSSPNSIMITQGGSVLHQVTETTIGNRSILKVAYDIYQ
jgi:hypothetical protein